MAKITPSFYFSVLWFSFFFCLKFEFSEYKKNKTKKTFLNRLYTENVPCLKFQNLLQNIMTQLRDFSQAEFTSLVSIRTLIWIIGLILSPCQRLLFCRLVHSVSLPRRHIQLFAAQHSVTLGKVHRAPTWPHPSANHLSPVLRWKNTAARNTEYTGKRLWGGC